MLHFRLFVTLYGGYIDLKKQTQNPIAIQSKEWLVTSLLTLMEQKPYAEITIQEIADQALLSRRTFYRNVSSKEDLLRLHFDKICTEYIDMLKQTNDLSLPSITEIFFSFWLKHDSFLILLKKNHIFGLLLDYFNQFIPTVYQSLKGNLHEYDTPQDLQYALSFSVGGFFNMLFIWLEEDCKRSPAKLSEVIQTAFRVSQGML